MWSWSSVCVLLQRQRQSHGDTGDACGCRCGNSDPTRPGVGVGEGDGAQAPPLARPQPPRSPAFENSGTQVWFLKLWTPVVYWEGSAPLEGVPGFCWTEMAKSLTGGTGGTPIFPGIGVLLWE